MPHDSYRGEPVTAIVRSLIDRSTFWQLSVDIGLPPEQK